MNGQSRKAIMNTLVTVQYATKLIIALQHRGCTMEQKLITNSRQLAQVRTTMKTEHAYGCFMILYFHTCW